MTAPKIHLIYLTGFMGSGKSTIGPILANSIGYSHADIDHEIERLTQKRIAEIFLEDGEPFFRSIERSVLEKYRSEKRFVISLGGGTIANETNFEIIRSSGLLVYLKADLEHIYKRLKHKTDRPIVRSEDGTTLQDDELRSKIKSVMARREPFYNRADIIIETSERRVGLTVDEIVRRISRFIE